uniref:Uncharacterized protein n=1 Tax=Glossina pallidipes TaxID=7398 RepID=A0A1A9ZUD2_GLOPL
MQVAYDILLSKFTKQRWVLTRLRLGEVSYFLYNAQKRISKALRSAYRIKFTCPSQRYYFPVLSTFLIKCLLVCVMSLLVVTNRCNKFSSCKAKTRAEENQIFGPSIKTNKTKKKKLVYEYLTKYASYAVNYTSLRMFQSLSWFSYVSRLLKLSWKTKI